MNRLRTHRFKFSAWGLPGCLVLEGWTERALQAAARLAMEEIWRIDAKFTNGRPDSTACCINRKACRDWFPVDAETDGVLDLAHRLWECSDGLFDLSVAPMMRYWNYWKGELPDADMLRALSFHGKWEHVQRQPGRIRLLPGMALDFGGIAKEYSLDRAANLLYRQGVHHGQIQLGRDVHVLGPSAVAGTQGSAWDVAVPGTSAADGATGKLLTSLQIRRGGFSTSGSFEQYMVVDGHRYGHLLDPGTGWPVDYWKSVSVAARTTTRAGGLATVAMLKGADGPAWLREQGVRFVAVRHDGVVVLGEKPSAPPPGVSSPMALESVAA